jgi:hypothetical protein
VSPWDALPKTLKVIGKRYKVRVVEKVDEEGNDGESDQASQTILAQQDAAHSFEYVREVVLHEAIHAEGLGVGILALLRENPAFVRWLMAREKE